MAKDHNAPYQSVRIKKETVAKLQRLRDKLQARDTRARKAQGIPPASNPISVNNTIEWLLYRLAKEDARQEAYTNRRREKKCDVN